MYLLQLSCRGDKDEALLAVFTATMTANK